MKFRGFRASLNFASGRMSSEFSENVSSVSVSGAYRTNKEEFFGSGSYSEPPKKITPSMVQLPRAFQPEPTDPQVIKASKSTTNLVQAKNLPPDLSKSTPDVSIDPRGAINKTRESVDLSANAKKGKTQAKDQKKLEKKRLEEQKKREKLQAQERVKAEKLRKEREKLELQERAKQEKLRKEREKVDAQQQAKAAKKDKKKAAPKAKNPLAQVQPPAPPPMPAANKTAGYSTNTLDSSISKTSGPPPYDDQPIEVTNPAMMLNETDDSGNTSFGKPIESDSTWDLVNQHRQQISRVPLTAAGGKQRFKLADNANANTNEGVTGRKSLYV